MTQGSTSLLKQAEDATLLEGNAEIRFRHQLLQEYFTASAMRTRIINEPPMAASDLWPAEHWWQRSGWEEAAVLLAGLCADDCTPVIRWLAVAQPEVAAQCILESGAGISDRDALYKGPVTRRNPTAMAAVSRGCRPVAYSRRRPEQTVLYRIVQHHLETYLMLSREGDWEGQAMPAYVERDFRRYLECGILAYGFASSTSASRHARL